MGANLSLLAPHAHTVAARSYVDVFSNLEFLSVVKNSRFLKTMKAYDRSTGMLVAVKIFVKPMLEPVDLYAVAEKVAREALLLAPHPCFLPWHQIIETSASAYLVRQLAHSSVYDRLVTRPFLAPIEKLWLVYQLLRAVHLLHEQHQRTHGDIKTENLLVTRAGWLVLADFAQHIKPAYLPNDNPSEFVFYFDSSNRRSCYLAPERFYTRAERAATLEARATWRVLPEMDMFSVGCVIAELYTDGEPTFSLSDLYRYKRGQGAPNVRIADPRMRGVVSRLLDVDPSRRPLAGTILAELRGTLFPAYFDDFLYEFMLELHSAGVLRFDDNYCESDRRIDLVYTNYDRIATALGFAYPTPVQSSASVTSAQDADFPHLKVRLPGVPNTYIFRTAEQIRLAEHRSADKESTHEQGALVLLETVFALVRSLRRPRSKIRACELILALLERVADEHKLDRALPYVCSLVADFLAEASRSHDAGVSSNNENIPAPVSDSSSGPHGAVVARVALLAMTNLLRTCSSVTTLNTLVFPEFVCPLLKSIAFLHASAHENSALVKCVMARCFPHLAQICERFRSFAAHDTQNTTGEREIHAASVRAAGDFKDIVEALLTDTSVDVRVAVVNHMEPLCRMLGVDRTIDIVLPHVLTYLNCSSYKLRVAFLACVPRIGAFLGALAFEQYMLPLLVRILHENEPLIDIRVVQVFHHFVKRRLVNPAAEFSARATYAEMLHCTLPLLVQPNEWMRQNVVWLVLAIAANLTRADRVCFLYPRVKAYLAHDVGEFTWDALYPSLTRPLTRQMVEMALVWYARAGLRGNFWLQTAVAVSLAHGRRKLVAFAKDLLRSHTAADALLRTDFTLSVEDRLWVLKLKAVGLDEAELWKVHVLREYLAGHTRVSTGSDAGAAREFELALAVNISPKTVFFDVRYKAEALGTTSTYSDPATRLGVPALLEAVVHAAPLSLVLARNGKAQPSLQTHAANVFGQLERRHDNHRRASGPRAGAGETRIVGTIAEQIVSCTALHSFGGSNPYILQYLAQTEFEAQLDDFAEFGLVVLGDMQALAPGAGLVGAQVGSFWAGDGESIPDPVTCIAASPTSEVVVTGTWSGRLCAWDASWLEQSAGGSLGTKSSSNGGSTGLGTGTGTSFGCGAGIGGCRVDLHLRITALAFMPHRWVFAVATEDSIVRLFRVDVTWGKNRRLARVCKLVSVRSTHLTQGYATSVQFVATAMRTLCIVATFECRIVALDVVRMVPVFDWQNPPCYGPPLALVACRYATWVLVGTESGVLCLWDVRFGILLAALRVVVDGVPQRREIRHLVSLLPPPGRLGTLLASAGAYVALAVADCPDISVWAVPSFTCTNCFSPQSQRPQPRAYTLQRLDVLRIPSAEDIVAELALDFTAQAPLGPRALYFFAAASAGADDCLVLVTVDLRVIVWNWRDATRSTLLFTAGRVSFEQSTLLSLRVCYERVDATQADGSAVSSVPETISDLCFVFHPHPMLVVGTDYGMVYVYK